MNAILNLTITLLFLVTVLPHNTVAGANQEVLNRNHQANANTDAIVRLSAALDDNSNRVQVGTGFIVSDDGIIITNYHTLVGIDSIEIALNNGKKLRFEGILGVDRQKDIAVLKVKGRSLPFLNIGSLDSLKIDTTMDAFGYGSKKKAGSKTKKTRHDLLKREGYIIAIKPLFNHSYDVIYSTNQISLGFSGGPVIDTHGNVVGIISRLLPVYDHVDSVICFAVPINYAIPLLKSRGIQTLKEFTERDKDNKEWWLIVGSAKSTKEHKEWDAVDYVLKALEIDPDYGEAYDVLGNIRLKQERYDEAMALFKRASELSPTVFFIYGHSGFVYKQKKMWNKAILAYEEELANFPMFGPTIMQLIMLYEKTGNLRKALEYIEAGITVYHKELANYPESASIPLRLAILYEKKGDIDKALEYTNKVVAANYDDGREYYLRANIYVKKAIRLGRNVTKVNKKLLTNAVKDYNQAVNIASKRIVVFNPDPLINLLKEFKEDVTNDFTGNQLRDLAEDPEKPFTLDPSEHFSSTSNPVVNKAGNNTSKQYNISLYSVSKTRSLCIDLYIRERFDEVISNLNSAIKLDKTCAEAFLLLRAKAYAHLRKWDKVIADCNRAIELDQNYASAYYLKGESYKKLGKHNKARKAFSMYNKFAHRLPVHPSMLLEQATRN